MLDIPDNAKNTTNWWKWMPNIYHILAQDVFFGLVTVDAIAWSLMAVKLGFGHLFQSIVHNLSWQRYFVQFVFDFVDWEEAIW